MPAAAEVSCSAETDEQSPPQESPNSPAEKNMKIDIGSQRKTSTTIFAIRNFSSPRVSEFSCRQKTGKLISYHKEKQVHQFLQIQISPLPDFPNSPAEKNRNVDIGSQRKTSTSIFSNTNFYSPRVSKFSRKEQEC